MKTLNKTNKLLLSSIIVFLGLILFSLLYNFRYLVADDFLINYLIEGYYGKGYNQISNPYVSVLLMSLLSLLQNIAPIFNWYYIYLFSTLIISFIILHLLMFRHNLPYYSHIFLIISQILLSILLTYTITAYLLIFVGFILYIKSINKKETIISIILIILGISTRTDAVITGLLLLFPIIIYEFIKNKNKKIIYFLIISLSTFAITYLTNNLILNANEVQKEYIEWNNASTQIRDFLKIDYEKYEEEFKEIDVSKNDLNCFYSWMFSNKDLFNTETLITISNFRNINEKYSFNPIFWVIMFFINKFYLLYVLLSILFLVLNKSNKYSQFTILTGFIALIGLAIRKRFVLRIIIPIIFITICFLLLYEKDFFIKRFNTKKTNILIIFSLIFSIIFLGLNHKDIFYPEAINTGNSYDYIKENEDMFFICDEYNTEKNIRKNICSVFNNDEKIENLTSLGNWTTFSTQYYYILDKYKIENKNNLYDAIVLEDIKYVSSNKIELEYFETYLDEHYENIELIQIYKSEDIEIYSIKEGDYEKKINTKRKK